MIQDFIKFWKDNHYFDDFRKPIKDIPRTSCSDSDIYALSFDEMKTRFYQALSLTDNHHMKSIDAIYIPKPAKDELVFVEMKKYNSTGNLDLVNYITSCGFENVRDKLYESLILLMAMMGYYNNIPQEFYNYFFDENRFKIKVVLLVNLTEYEMNTLSRLGLCSYKISLKKLVGGTIILYNCKSFNKDFKDY